MFKEQGLVNKFVGEMQIIVLMGSNSVVPRVMFGLIQSEGWG